MSPTPFNLPPNAKIVAKHGTTSVYSLKDGRLAFVDYEKQRMFLDGSKNFGSNVYGFGHNSSWADERLASIARKGGSDALVRVKAVKPKQSAMPQSYPEPEEEEIPDTNFTRAMRFIPQAFLDWAKTYKPGDALPVMPPGYGDKALCDKSISNDSYSQSGVTVDDVVKDTLEAMGFSDINPELAFLPEIETKSMPKFEQKGILGREIRDMARNVADSILTARGLWRDELNKIRCGSGPNANRFTDIFGTGCDVPGADMAGNLVGMIRSGDEIPGPVDDLAGKLEGAREEISDVADGTDLPGGRGSMREFLSAKLTGVRGGHTPHIEGDSPMTDHDPAAAMTGTRTPARPSERWKFMGLRSLVNRNKQRERKKKTEEAAKKAKREYSEFLSSDEYRRWEADFVRTNGRLPNAGEKIHQYALHLGYESPVTGGTFMGLADISSIDNSKTHHEAMVDQILNDPRIWPFGKNAASARQIANKRKEIEDNLEEYYLMTLHSAYNAGGPKQIEVVRPDGTIELVDNPEHKERFISAVPGYFRIKHPADSMNNNPSLADAIAVTSVNQFWSPGGGEGNLVGFVGREGARFDPITGVPIPHDPSSPFPGQIPGSGALTPSRPSNLNNGSTPLWAQATNNPFGFTVTLDPIWFSSRDYQNQKIKGFGANHLGMELSRESFLMHTADHEINHVDDFSWRLGQKLGYRSQSEWMDRLKGQTFNPGTGTWSDVIDLRRDARADTFLRQEIDRLDAVLNRPGVSNYAKMEALWEFYLKNINFDSGVESRYARWLANDYSKVPGGARLTKEAIARKLQEIRDNLSARGYGEETGVPQMNFWRDMVDTLTGTWNPTTRTFDGVMPANIMNLLRGDSRLNPSGAIPLGQARLDNAVSNILAGFMGGTYSGESDWEFAAELRTHLNKRGALEDIREFLADPDRNIHNLDETGFMTLVAKYVGEDEVYRLYGETPPPDRFTTPPGAGGGTPPGGGGGGGGLGPGTIPTAPSGGGGGSPTPPPVTPPGGGGAPSPRTPPARPRAPTVPRADDPGSPYMPGRDTGRPAKVDDIPGLSDDAIRDEIDRLENRVYPINGDVTTPRVDSDRVAALKAELRRRGRGGRRRSGDEDTAGPRSGNLRGSGLRDVIDIGRPGFDGDRPETDMGYPGTGTPELDVGSGRLRGDGVRRPTRPKDDSAETEVDTGRLRGSGVERSTRPKTDGELVEPRVRPETDEDRVSPERRRADAERQRRIREISGYPDDIDERDRKTLQDDLLNRRGRIKDELERLDKDKDSPEYLSRTEELEAMDDEIGEQLIELQFPDWRERRSRGEAERASRRKRVDEIRERDVEKTRPRTTVSEAREQLDGARERARDRRFAERQEADRRSEEAIRDMAEARGETAAPEMTEAELRADRIRLNQIREERVNAVARVAEAESRHDDALRRARSTGSDPDRGGDGDPAAWAEYRAAYEELNDADAANADLLRESRELEDRMSQNESSVAPETGQSSVRSYERQEIPEGIIEEGDTRTSAGTQDAIELAAEEIKQRVSANPRESDYSKQRASNRIDNQVAARRTAIEKSRTATDPQQRRAQQILAASYEIELLEGSGQLDYESAQEQKNALSDLADMNGTPLYFGDDGLYRMESSVPEWQRTERVGEMDKSTESLESRRRVANRIFGEAGASELLGQNASQPTTSRPETMKMINRTSGEIVYVDPNDNDVIQRLRGEGFSLDLIQETSSAPSSPKRTTRSPSGRPSRPRRRKRGYTMVDGSGNKIFIDEDDGDGYYDAMRDGFREINGPEAGMSGDDRQTREFRRQRQIDDLLVDLTEGNGAFMSLEEAYLQRDGSIVQSSLARDRRERLIKQRDGIENGVIGADLSDEEAERRVARLNEQIDQLSGEIAYWDKAAELYEAHARNIDEGPDRRVGRLRDQVDTSLRRGYSSGGWPGDDDGPEAGMGQTYDRFLQVHANVVDRKAREIEEVKRLVDMSGRGDSRDLAPEEAGEIAASVERLFSGDMRIDRNFLGSLSTELLSNGRTKIKISAYVDPNLVSIGPDGSLNIPVSMQLRSADGKTLYGYASRYIEVSRDDMTVNHGSLTIEKPYRGKGIASEFNARNENLYRAIGVRSITTLGSSSTGPDSAVYGTGATHWARNGFTWRNDAARDSFIGIIDNAIRSRPELFTPEERQRIGSLYKRGKNGTFSTDATPEELVDFEAADEIFAERQATIPFKRDLVPSESDSSRASRFTKISDRLTRRGRRRVDSGSRPQDWDPQAEIEATRTGETGDAVGPELMPDWIRNWDPTSEMSSARQSRAGSSVGDDGPEAGMSGGGPNTQVAKKDKEGRPLTGAASPTRSGTVEENYEANLRSTEEDIQLVKSEIEALQAAIDKAKTTGEWRGADFGVHFGDDEPSGMPQIAYLTRTEGGLGVPVNLNAEETKQKDAIGKAEKRIASAKKEVVRLSRVATDKRARRDQNVLDVEDIPAEELEQLLAEAEDIRVAIKKRDNAKNLLKQDPRFKDLDLEQRDAAIEAELERMGMPNPLSPGTGQYAAVHVGADTLERGVLDPGYTSGDESMMTGGGNTGSLNQNQIRIVGRQREETAGRIKAGERLVEQLDAATTNLTPGSKEEADLLNAVLMVNKFSVGKTMDLSTINPKFSVDEVKEKIREDILLAMDRDRVSLARQDRILKRVDESPRFGYLSAYPLGADGTTTEGYFGRYSGKKVPANIGTFLSEVEGRHAGKVTGDGFVNVKDRPMLDRWKKTLRGTQWLVIGGDDTVVRGFGYSPSHEAQVMGINTPVFGFSFGVEEAANYRTVLSDIGMALAARAVDLRRRGEEVTPESVMEARRQVETSRIIMLAKSGKTIEEIAEKTGRSRQFVSELLRLAGVTNPYTEGL